MLKIMQADEKKEFVLLVVKREAQKRVVVVVVVVVGARGGWMGRCHGWVHVLQSLSI